MGSTATITIETCPSTEEEILALGRFQLRTLADLHGIFKDADEKQAFLKLSTEEQARAVFAAKMEHDKQTKGGGKAKPALTRTPATSKPATTTKPATKPTESSANESAGNTGGNAALVIDKLNELLEAVNTTNENVTALREEVGILQGSVAGTNRLSMVGVSLALQMAEQVLNAPAGDVLTAAIEQVNEIEPQLREILESAPEGSADEGND